MPVHVVVRDYPETLAVFRGVGVDVAASGGLPLGDAVPDAAASAHLVQALIDAVAWRDGFARRDSREAP